MAEATTHLGFREVSSLLVDRGFTAAFGLMAEDTAGLVTALIEGGVSYRSARQENSAVTMADGYARATGTVGLCILSRGPGMLNGLGAAASADRAGTPLLIISGDGPLVDGQSLGAAFDLKSMDHVAAIESVGIAAYRPTGPGEVIGALGEALQRARTGHVAVLLLPITFMEGEIEPGDLPLDAGVAPISPEATEPGDEELAAAAALIGASQRILVVGGRGAHLAGAREALIELAARTDGALGTSLLGKDMFAGEPFDFGIVGGFSHAAARELIPQADCIITFGAGLNRFTTAGGLMLDAAKVIQVDSDATRLGLRYPAELTVHGDAALTARRLTALIDQRPQGTGFRTDAVRSRLADRAPDELFEDHSTETTVDPRSLLIALNRLVPKQRNVSIDCGHFVGFPAMYLDVLGPGHIFWSLHFGMLGIGHGIGLGVAVGRPDEPSVVVLGDGGTLMTLGELETLSRVRPPATVVILDDGAYVAEKHYLELHGESGSEAIFGRETDFAGIAAKLGVESATIRSVADLEALGERIGRVGEPLVLDCKIPRVLAGWYHEMLTGEFVED